MGMDLKAFGEEIENPIVEMSVRVKEWEIEKVMMKINNKRLKNGYRDHVKNESVSVCACIRSLCSRDISGSDDDLEDGFSELETPANANESTVNALAGNEDQLISEPELSDDDNDDIGEPAQIALELSDNETNSVVKSSPRKRATTELFNAIVSAPDVSLQSVLDKWVAEGKDLDRLEISNAMIQSSQASNLSEWFEANKPQEFVERDYASRLDLIAKVRGLHKADVYINKIPKSFKGEVIYRTLLANCVVDHNVKKAEEVFNKMRDLEFPITPFACNQLLLLYKRLDKKKIADVLLLMEKENVKPSLFTYKILIDTKGQSNDMTGMDQIKKAEAILKEMEGGNLEEHRWACRFMLPLYGALGKADEVSRVWKFCEKSPRLDECMAAIEAWGRLKKIDEAEAWVSHRPFEWDALVKLYVEAGEVEKADSILNKAVQQNQIKPMYSSFLIIMERYATKGDIHNAEKMFSPDETSWLMHLGGQQFRICLTESSDGPFASITFSSTLLSSAHSCQLLAGETFLIVHAGLSTASPVVPTVVTHGNV
ncbi:pentatricopeptide repeat-containing protein [Populus alba x Populus x berolinensis]|nr:pentatricopeptide repeat-containing protein [Populus alba x Populus x berolinensis]